MTCDYKQLYKSLEKTSTNKYLVSTCYAGFSTKEDIARAEKFFEGKDVSKYNMALAQAYDSIKAKIRWIEVSLGCFRCVIQIVVKKVDNGTCSGLRTIFRATSTSGRKMLLRSCEIR